MIEMSSKYGFVEKTPRSSKARSGVGANSHTLIATIIIAAMVIATITIYAGATIRTNSEIAYRTTANHVVINEIYYDAPAGYSEPQCEWIELYNPTASAVNLSGWKLADGPNNTSAEGEWVFPSDATISAYGYLLIVNDATYKGSFNSLFPGVTPDYDTNTSNTISDVSVSGTLTLANTGDDIHLFDSSGVEIDAVWYGNGGDMGSDNAAPAVASGHSLARYYNAEDTDIPADDFYEENSPSPKEVNSEAIPEMSITIPALAIILVITLTIRKRK
ncbi:MAG: lamin tail domain-containing protein [Euryarchaeota archaeon]|nr:lamin tail domain-containing protein [Euryarchaeota archaeon]